MNDKPIVEMADILPPLVEQQSSSDFWLILLVLSIALVLGVFLWRYYHSPLKQLSSSLSKGCKSPRQVAHQLALLVMEKPELAQELDQLRFQRQPPDADQVRQLIKRAAQNG